MPKPYHDDEEPSRKAMQTGGERGSHDEPMEEEEKILAGRPDVNIPALLTKDVQGG